MKQSADPFTSKFGRRCANGAPERAAAGGTRRVGVPRLHARLDFPSCEALLASRRARAVVVIGLMAAIVALAIATAAPLWGIGLTEVVSGHTRFLHDGRARSLVETILWHGGEAEAATAAFRSMSRPDRDALVAFLNSL